jgi:NAD(P)-dependent dehydrogenase (short-subunit alcohol dehydrogenase family)
MIHHFLAQKQADTIPSLPGTIITLSTGAAGMPIPSMSSYISSKLAQTRIMEILHVEQPNIRSFTLLPGLLKTAMTADAFKPFARDDPMLAGGLSLFLSTPRADWLRGGIMSVNCTSKVQIQAQYNANRCLKPVHRGHRGNGSPQG